MIFWPVSLIKTKSLSLLFTPLLGNFCSNSYQMAIVTTSFEKPLQKIQSCTSSLLVPTSVRYFSGVHLWQKDTYLLPNKDDMSIVVCNWQNQNGWTASVADFAQGSSAKFAPYTFFPRTRDQKEQNESRSVAKSKLEQIKNTSWWTFYNASKFKGEQTTIVMSISVCVCQTFIDMRISVPVCKTFIDKSRAYLSLSIKLL